MQIDTSIPVSSGIPEAAIVFSLVLVVVLILLWRFYSGIFKKVVYTSRAKESNTQTSLLLKMWNMTNDAISLKELSGMLPFIFSLTQGTIDEISCSKNITVDFEKGASTFTVMPLEALIPNAFFEKWKKLIWLQIDGNDLSNEVVVHCEKKFGYGIYYLQVPTGWLLLANGLGLGVFFLLVLAALTSGGSLIWHMLYIWLPIGSVLLAGLFFLAQEMLYKRILTRLV